MCKYTDKNYKNIPRYLCFFDITLINVDKNTEQSSINIITYLGFQAFLHLISLQITDKQHQLYLSNLFRCILRNVFREKPAYSPMVKSLTCSRTYAWDFKVPKSRNQRVCWKPGAIRRIFEVFTYGAIFKSNKKGKVSFCPRSNCLSPFMGEFWSEEWNLTLFIALNITICNTSKIRLIALGFQHMRVTLLTTKKLPHCCGSFWFTCAEGNPESWEIWVPLLLLSRWVC